MIKAQSLHKVLIDLKKVTLGLSLTIIPKVSCFARDGLFQMIPKASRFARGSWLIETP